MAAAVVAMCLVACAPTRPPRAESDAAVVAAVEAVPGVDGVLLSQYTAGLSGSGLTMKVFLDANGQGDLAAVADEVIGAAWSAVPYEPEGITLQALPGPLPDGARFGDSSDPGIDLTDVASRLGLESDDDSGSHLGSAGTSLHLKQAFLSARYGAWNDPG
ncbi:hypothetical protein [Protaetiibacter intestinalis]|uniref:Uncharacterized protein n=1 Tax=Protaetiibacter intestinalis TaxID=2419774 RepID=A0A387B9U3_9MICO|nr:hypothetical protein [Protaetiibacter intestinalis]AYF98528.1 hypothetical protein D7I47_09820 [Protaetiibacter intestinalis]